MRAPTSYLKLDQEQRRPIVSSFDVTAFYSLLYHSQLSLIFDYACNAFLWAVG